MTNGYSLFSGCSYTQGEGFALRKNDPQLWVNQVYAKNKAIHPGTDSNKKYSDLVNAHLEKKL
jgi:hypothetical protein